ncbi:MAG: hypothetical protein QOE58_2491 [Actinomycetota bacterium]|jgi:hypothetical protein|nr:hypothetical protein [Actinomycetota bacterium]
MINIGTVRYSIWGTAITQETIYNSNHEQRIDGGRSYAASHDIWGAKGR